MAATAERESLFCDSQFTKSALNALSTQKQNAMYCDVIMRICGKELYAHSNILAATSPYFSVFLAQDLPRQFSQRSPQIIEIQIEGSYPSHLYEEALESIIDFIYTGKLKVKANNAFQIIEIARIMQMNSVVIFCEAFLQGKLPGASETVVTPPSVLHSVAVNTDESGKLNTKFKGNKFVSVATLVNPQLLGLKNVKRQCKDEKTQTSERDFATSCTTRTGRPRGRPRKHHAQTERQDPEQSMEEIPENGDTRDQSSENAEETGAEEGEPDADAELPSEMDVEESTQTTEQSGESPDANVKVPVSSAVSILESKPEGASDEAQEEGSTPLSPTCGARRSARRFKPTARLQEASRNMVVDETVSDPQQDDDDDDDDILVKVIPPKKRRGRPPKLRPRQSTFATTKMIQAEALISKLTAKPNKDSENDLAKGDGPEYPNDNQKENSGSGTEEADQGEEVQMDPDYDDAEDIKHGSETEEPKSVSRSGRVRTITSTASALKKPVRPKYQCGTPNCNFATNRVREMSNHHKLHKLEQNVCYYCENKYDRREDLIEHLEKHKGPTPFYCPVCDIRFKSRTQLSVHIPKHSDEKPFKCELCDARFKWKHAVKNHMVVHSNKKDHLCDICGYATAHKSQLKAHRLIHTGNTYKCSFPGCDFQATKRQNLKYHLFSHTQEKPHQCEICGQNFSLVKNLRRHMLLHSSDSKHSCEKCEFHTTRFDKLKEHLLRQHAIGTPPEKRVRVSELVMQNYIGIQEDNETAEMNANEDCGDGEQTDMAEEEVAMETVTAADGTIVHTVVDAANISGIAGANALSIATGESGQHIEFLEMPSETIIIQSIETGDDEQITLPIVTQDGTTIHAASEVEEGDGKDSAMQSLGYTEIMIPVSQISDFVQHVTYVSQ